MIWWRKQPVDDAAASGRTRSVWAAASVISTGRRCEAALAVKGRRFLAREAPMLPLSDCNTPGHCVCCYRKHADRRAAARRSDELGGLVRQRAAADERRTQRGRRVTD